MRTYRVVRMLVVLAALGCVCAVLTATAGAQQVTAGAGVGVDVQMQAGVQVQTRGPIHEAFASIVSFEPKPGFAVAKTPPEAIEEIPPDQKPEGDNVEWIPGYWSWDDERENFIWLSGIWRAIPPGRQFVPGCWIEVGGGFRWTSGYWREIEVEEVVYLPEPPRTLEVGANIEPPSPSHIWTPGCWAWRETRYAWRPGFWIAARPDWTWAPAHYVWAPGGFVFVNGYWDFDLHARGVLFAPVYYERPVYLQAGYAFTPSITIDVGLVTDHLFVRPTFQHYYFGDFYAANYTVAGFMPWFSFHASAVGYDPIYAHYRAQRLLVDGNWDNQLRAQYEFRREHIEARPPQTFTAQLSLAARATGPVPESAALAKPLAQLAASKTTALRFERLDAAQRNRFAESAKQADSFRLERKKLEMRAAAAAPAKPSKETGPLRLTLAKSPIGSTAAAKGGKGKAAPPSPVPPGAGPAASTKADVGGPGKGAAPKAGVKPDVGGRGKEAPKIDTRPDRGAPAKGAPKTGTEPAPAKPGKEAPKIDARPDRGGPAKGSTKEQTEPDRGGGPDKGAPKGGGKGKK